MRHEPTERDRKIGFNGHLSVHDEAIVFPSHQRWGAEERRVLCTTSNRIVHKNDEPADLPVDDDIAEKEAEERLSGTYLFGGAVRMHFGHFLVDCLGTLWAPDMIDERLDGVLFLPFRGDTIERDHAMEKMEREVALRLGALGFEDRVRIIRKPTQVERLWVAENGFGQGPKFGGSSFFSGAVRRRIEKAQKARVGTPRRKIFVTRTGLHPARGHVIGEETLARTFADAGYEIFYPERHPLSVQLDTYRSASHVAGTEGSALHLPPFSCGPETRVAIIGRRSTRETILDYWGEQFRQFTGIEPDVISHIQAIWGPSGAVRRHRDSLSVIDFDRTYTDLTRLGYLPPTTARHMPPLLQLTEEVARSSKAHGTHFEVSEILESAQEGELAG